MEIRQIIPADGWYAVVACCHPEEEAYYELERLAAWALIEDDGEERLTGVGASLDVEFVDYLTVSPTVDMAWLGYVHADDLTAEKKAHLQRLVENEQKIRRDMDEEARMTTFPTIPLQPTPEARTEAHSSLSELFGEIFTVHSAVSEEIGANRRPR